MTIELIEERTELGIERNNYLMNRELKTDRTKSGIELNPTYCHHGHDAPIM